MKKLFALLVLSATLLGCRKDSPFNPDSYKPEKLIVNKQWQIQKITSAQSNTLFYYERGGQSNWDYSQNLLLFKPDGTGEYTDGSNLYEITWEFTNSAKDELSYVIEDYANGQPAPGLSMEVELENINVTATSLKYAEIYTNENGSPAVSSVHRIPVAEIGK